ncbi:hypothetical protein SNEBB_002134 [Seison nebaliae]|nr:hypothetical protein SNEBB_002134 [Seison nebaliae]
MKNYVHWSNKKIAGKDHTLRKLREADNNDYLPWSQFSISGQITQTDSLEKAWRKYKSDDDTSNIFRNIAQPEEVMKKMALFSKDDEDFKFFITREFRKINENLSVGRNEEASDDLYGKKFPIENNGNLQKSIQLMLDKILALSLRGNIAWAQGKETFTMKNSNIFSLCLNSLEIIQMVL